MTSEKVLLSQIMNMLQSYAVYFQEATKKQKIEQLLRSQTRPYKKLEAFLLQKIPSDKKNQFLKQFYKMLYPPVVNEYFSIQSKQILMGKIQDVEIGAQSSEFFKVFNEKTEVRVKNSLEACQSMQQFLELQIYQIIDILQRKSPLIDYFTILKKHLRLVGRSVLQAFKQITFVDFIILLMKLTQPNNFISVLLAQQSAPIPITYSVMQNKMHNTQAISWILGSAKYPLVIDIWTEEAANRLKVYKQYKVPQKIYFSQIFNISPQYFEGCSFESNVNLFKLSLASHEEHQNILLVSLISYQEEGELSLSIKQSFIKNLIKSASFVIVHIDDNNSAGQSQEKAVPSIFKNFKFIFEDSIQKMYIVELAQYYYHYYQKIILNFNNGNLFYFNEIQNDGYHQDQQNKLAVINAQKIFLQTFKQKKYQAGSQSLLNGLDNIILLNTTPEQQIRSFFKDKLAKFLENKQILLSEYYRAKRVYQIRMKLRNMNLEQYQNEIEHKISENLQKKIKNFEIARKQLQEQEKKIKKIIKEGKNVNLSQFVLQYMKFVKKDNIRFQLSLQILKEETNKKIFSQLSKLQQLKKSTRNQQHYRQQKMILSKRISIDNIIQQFNYYKFDNIDYYQKCTEISRPFSLIDREKRSFGNQLLKAFLERLNQKINKKNVFIVSVIGNQKSGKISILSKLFPKSINFKQDPLAKGVYMSVHQVNNKTIVVLDVLGIINLTNQDRKYSSQQLRTQFAAFDHRQISLIMKQSNLVILLETLKQRWVKISQISLYLGIYITILNSFTFRNSQKNIIPKNVIFAFSNGGYFKFQKKDIVEALIRELKPILMHISVEEPRYNNLRSVFDKYVFLTQQDVIFLPPEQQGNQSLKRPTEGYGAHILALRNRVMRKIHEIQEMGLSSRTIIDFYQAAKVSWQTILVTTKNVVQTLSIKQLDQKLRLYQIYRQSYREIYNTEISYLIQKRYNLQKILEEVLQVRNNTQKIQPFPSIDQVYSALLDQIARQEKKYQQDGKDVISIAYSKFQQECNMFRQYQFQFRDFATKNFRIICNLNLYHYLEYSYSIRKQQNVQKMTWNYLIKLVQRINLKNINDKEFIQIIYQQKAKQFFDQLVMNRQGDRLKIFRQITGITRDFKIILLSQHIFQNLQIEDINDCLDFDENDNLKFLNKVIDFQNNREIISADQSKLIRLIQNKIQIFEQLMKTSQLGYLDQIINFVNQKIDKIIQQTNQDVEKQAQQIYQHIDNKKSNLEIQEKIQKKLLEVIQNMRKKENISSNQEIEKTYYENLFNRTNNQAGKILLNRINLKIILLGKLFRFLKNSTDQYEIKEIEKMRNQFERDKKFLKDMMLKQK